MAAFRVSRQIADFKSPPPPRLFFCLIRSGRGAISSRLKVPTILYAHMHTVPNSAGFPSSLFFKELNLAFQRQNPKDYSHLATAFRVIQTFNFPRVIFIFAGKIAIECYKSGVSRPDGFCRIAKRKLLGLFTCGEADRS